MTRVKHNEAKVMGPRQEEQWRAKHEVEKPRERIEEERFGGKNKGSDSIGGRRVLEVCK